MKKTWKVTMELWRETWSDHNQCDNTSHVEIVQAVNAKAAINKAKKQALNPGKGKRWSHYVWVQNAQAEVASR